MSTSENKCRCCLTTKGPFTDRTINDKTGDDILYLKKIKYIFPDFEFNMTNPYVICAACGEKVDKLFMFKEEIYKRNAINKHTSKMNTSNAKNRVCCCCQTEENVIKLETELIDSLQLYLHHIFAKHVLLGGGTDFKLCLKCFNKLETFHVMKENIFHANAVHENKLLSDNIEYKLEPEIDNKVEYFENTVLNDNIFDKQNMCKSSSTYNNSNLKQVSATHFFEKSYECEHCSKRFKRPGQLKRHLLIHAGEKKYECEHCEKRFTRSYNLKSHLLTHTGEKKYECEHCEKRFARSQQLKIHLLTHTAEKKYECEHCKKRFTQYNNLKSHLLTHTGEKKYECEHCEKRFARSQQLKIHLLTHTGEKKYECEHCEKRFAQSHNLKRHLLTHTGEKKYECEHCEKRFTRSFCLKSHLLTHTGEKKT